MPSIVPLNTTMQRDPTRELAGMNGSATLVDWIFAGGRRLPETLWLVMEALLTRPCRPNRGRLLSFPRRRSRQQRRYQCRGRTLLGAASPVDANTPRCFVTIHVVALRSWEHELSYCIRRSRARRRQPSRHVCVPGLFRCHPLCHSACSRVRMPRARCLVPPTWELA